jgi:hypothetical protein
LRLGDKGHRHPTLLTHLAIEFESPEEAPVAAGTHPQTGKSETRPCDPAAPFSALIFKRSPTRTSAN